MWSQVVTLFREYMGTGLIVGWFLISVVYLLFKEKRKHFRILFLYVPVILLLLYFNPLFARIVYGIAGAEIYYRILWLMPVTVVIAYAMMQLYGSIRGRARIIFFVLGCGLIMISGRYIYHNTYFSRAENLYHMPQTVVDICDAIQVEGREVQAVFPVEMLQYVRQYTPFVWMPYGREITVERWTHNHPLYDVMEAQVIQAKELARLARESGCHYIVISRDKELVGDITDYEYKLFGEFDEYQVFLDTTAYLGL